MLWWRRLLARLGIRRDTIACVRQVDTWTWPRSLGRMTTGVCASCGEPIFYERQNRHFRKVCAQCAGFCD